MPLSFSSALAFAQGTLSVSLTQQVNQNGQPLSGCLFYTFIVGTVAAPQSSYQDPGLVNLNPWPLECDQNGRIPAFYLASGSVHIRLTDASGNVQFDYPNALVIGPSGGGGGGGGASIDPTTIFSTGGTTWKFDSLPMTGWVRLNGNTIGSASSGGTERANADTQNLFVYLWNNCPNTHCPVPGGRGASALADFQANKQITLPNMQDSIPVGRDCMGATCAGGLLASNVTSGGGDGVDTPGASGGLANQTSAVAQANLPNVNFNVTIPAGQGSHTHNLTPTSNLFVIQGGAGTIEGGGSVNSNVALSGITAAASTLPAMAGTAASGGSGTPLSFAVMNPFKLVTYFMKL